jgi:hypothetical protein
MEERQRRTIRYDMFIKVYQRTYVRSVFIQYLLYEHAFVVLGDSEPIDKRPQFSELDIQIIIIIYLSNYGTTILIEFPNWKNVISHKKMVVSYGKTFVL